MERASLLDQQMAERRERILEAARQIIGERGYDGLTMRDLATAGRVTVPTIYNLIGNKEQVLLAAVEQQTGDFVSGIEREAGDVIAVVEAAVGELLRLPNYYRALLPLLATSEAGQPAGRIADRALAAEFEQALSEIRERGELEDWVEVTLLRERLQSHLDMTAREWARGRHTAASFRGTARFEAALMLAAVTSGESRTRFETIAQASQAEAKARRGRRRRTAESHG